MSSIVRAIDVGFGQTKYVAAVHGNTVECAHFPSVVRLHVVDPIDRPSLGGRRRTVLIPIGTLLYEVGHEIHLAGARIGAPLPIEDYVGSNEYLALLRGALVFMNEPRVDLLVVGLPVSMFSKCKAKLERLATGEHILGKSGVVRVERALAVAQPQGALVTYATQHEALDTIRRQENLIIDAASRTFDWLVASGLKLVSNRSFSAPCGVHDILRLIAESISAKIGEDYDDLDAIDLALRKQKALTLFGEPHPIQRYKPIVDSVAQEAVRAMLGSIGGRYRFDNIVLVGGGAPLFKKAVHTAFAKQQRIQEVAEPHYANVRGYQRAGMDKMAGRASDASAQTQE
jgi:plasmid segregation protein ParM